jgi:hypothetical protein
VALDDVDMVSPFVESSATGYGFGESIDYTPDGGRRATFLAVVERDSAELNMYDDGQGRIRRAFVHCAVSDVPVVTEEGDLVQFPLVTGGSPKIAWTVKSGEGPESGMWRLTVERYDPTEKSHRDYRIRR